MPNESKASARPASGITMRKIEPGDLARVHDIRIRAFAPIDAHVQTYIDRAVYAHELADWKERQGAYLDAICAPGSKVQVYVAALGERIVGFIGVSVDPSRKTGEIDLNAVDPAFQGRGIGTAMYAFALAEMQALGAELAAVSTGGDAGHSAARRAYEKAGFTNGVPSVRLYRRL